MQDNQDVKYNFFAEKTVEMVINMSKYKLNIIVLSILSHYRRLEKKEQSIDCYFGNLFGYEVKSNN